MAEEVNNVIDVHVEDIIKRIKDLQSARTELANLKEELTTHQKDLANVEAVYGVGSKEYTVKKEMVDLTTSKIEDAEKKVSELTLKQSEIKPTLDKLTKDFEDAYRTETSKEYHIELTTSNGEEDTTEKSNKGKKVFKQLIDYLYHNVTFTPKTAVSLMMLVRDMESQRSWVQSKEFDNVIILKSGSVISLWKFIQDELTGTGFYEAKKFLECWAHCGQAVSTAIREIQKDRDVSKSIATDLNLVEDEFNRSEDDLPHDETEVTTQEEVAPEVEG